MEKKGTDQIKYSKTALDDFASSKGCLCLSETYIGYNTPHLWQCDNGHYKPVRYTHDSYDKIAGRDSKSCCFTTNADFNANQTFKKRGINQICILAVKQKKSVRFRRAKASRDGTSEVMRVSDNGEPVEQPIPPQ